MCSAYPVLLLASLCYDKCMSQLHIRAEAGAVAETVLLPGDPHRATFIAETFLTDVTQYNSYRELRGYTGTYNGVRVSVQTSGMGCPSLGIVAEEIINLGAKNLIRVGTTGAVNPNVRPTDLVIATASVANEGTTRQYLGDAAYAPVASFPIVRALVDQAGDERPVHVGLIQTEDAFYATSPEHVPELAARGVLSIEMEASALFTIAALRQVQAGCILVASNNIGDDSFVDPDALQQAVHDMAKTALDAAVELAGGTK